MSAMQRWRAQSSPGDEGAAAMIAYITPRDGVCRRFALISTDRDDALQEARLLGRALYGRGFTFAVRAA